MKESFNYWKTKDGRVVKISEMSENHLKNTIEFVRRICAKIEKSFQEYEKDWNRADFQGVDISDYIPFPLESVGEFDRRFVVGKNYLKIMELELLSRK